jgi:hypothetical protein
VASLVNLISEVNAQVTRVNCNFYCFELALIYLVLESSNLSDSKSNIIALTLHFQLK